MRDAALVSHAVYKIDMFSFDHFLFTFFSSVHGVVLISHKKLLVLVVERRVF